MSTQLPQMVAVSFFVVEVFTYGFIKSFGIFLQDLMQEFGESNSRVSWIVSICVFVMCFTAPPASLLTRRFGFRPVVMAGGLFLSMGTITSGFTNTINQMYIRIGLFGGLGFSLIFLPTITILSQYFSQRRYLVISVASTGECFSIIILAPAFAALRDHIGWRSTLVVIGALQCIIVICGILLRPIIIRPGPAMLTETQGPSDKEPEVLNPKDSSNSKESMYTEDISDTTDGSCTQQSSCSEDKELIPCYSLSSGEFENIGLRPLHHQVLEDSR
ncbi:hypothetical protein UPYG_G00134540 [Umbra pygmaea]|uniref:Major facilitator superfamily (MFS) profile domain-containing protein n=1 Tax=Umbra pygmaea TaxID=75934 RepID=A0ABD0WTT7_UMBPY